MEKELAFNQLNKLIEDLESIDLFPSLVWLWTWDIIVNFKNDSGYELKAPLEDIWSKIWQDIEKLDWSLTYGDEQLYEQVRDWLIENEFLVDTMFEDGE